jgi:hypothetical protein
MWIISATIDLPAFKKEVESTILNLFDITPPSYCQFIVMIILISGPTHVKTGLDHRFGHPPL